MDGKTNAGLIMAVVNVSCSVSSTVTLTKGSMTLSKTGTSLSFKLPSAGTWAFSATSGSLSDSRTLNLSPGQTLSITVNYEKYLYNRGSGTLATGWYKIGNSAQSSLNQSSMVAGQYIECKIKTDAGSGDTVYYRSANFSLSSLKRIIITGLDCGHARQDGDDGLRHVLTLKTSSGTTVQSFDSNNGGMPIDEMKNSTWSKTITGTFSGNYYLEMAVSGGDYTSRTFYMRLYTVWVSPTTS